MAKRSPNPTDVIVGENIRICRLQKSLSQGELGHQIGVTFQQVQKYEKGANRVGASRLNMIAGALGVTLSALFEGVGTAAQAPAAPGPSARAMLTDPHALRLLQGFCQIENDATKLSLLQLVESLVVTRAAKRRAA